MSFSRRIPLSRLKGFITCNIPAKWRRLAYPLVLFAIVLSCFHYRVKLSEAARNLAVSGAFSFITVAAPSQGATYSIWPLTTIPTVLMEDDENSIEIGMKFRSDSNGYISGIRFYKGGPENAGTHYGHLWTSAGTLLGTVKFTNETSSGWQQASFQKPIPITANTIYVVSYFAPQGRYIGEDGFFASSGVDNGPLHALSNATPGGNGVYLYTSQSAFPTDTYESENYWVDVVFATTTPPMDTTPPAVLSFAPVSGAAGVNIHSNVTLAFGEMIDAATVNGSTIELRDPSNVSVAATVSYNAASLTVTVDPTAALLSGVTYTARVKGGGTDPRVKDVAGNAMAADLTWSFTTTPLANCPCSIWGAGVTPTASTEDPGSAIELGMKFRSEVDGYISGVRFYKKAPENSGPHVGHLWSSSGTQLGEVTFTGETSIGWQQASFSTPIPITANTTYVVSYFAPHGNYIGEDGFFASSGVDNGQLHALKDGDDGGNGVYRYDTSGFPTDTSESENYWVDVVFINATSDTTPPTITSTSPAAGATNVNANANLTVTFSEAMNAATVSGLTVELRDPSNNLVPATVSYDVASRTATLDPSDSLVAGTTYTAKVRGGSTDPRAKDTAGTALAADVTWTFTTTFSCLANVPTNRWKGEYFNNIDLAGSPATARDDGAGFISFNFGEGGPGGNCGLGVDSFSARWTRTVNFAAGTYRFNVTADDGVRLYVDGQMRIDKWLLQSPTTYTVDLTFNNAGEHEIRLEYFENTVSALVSLSWATSEPSAIKLKEYVYAGGRLIASEEKSCVPTLSPASAPWPKEGGSGSFNFSTLSTCDWTATSNASWITINGATNGTGPGSVSYSVAANTGAQRTGTITVNGQPFTITQDLNPSSCSYSLNQPGKPVSEQPFSGFFNLDASAGCSWTAVSNAPSWLTVTSPAGGSGVGFGSIGYSVAANSGQQRIGSISITAGGQTVATFTVTQAPNQASCTFALSPNSGSYPVGGGNGSFNVTTGAGCEWDADTLNGWITINGGATNPEGGGSGPVSFTVQANNGGSRSGQISVRGQAFAITQAQCDYAISPTTAGFGGGGGTGSITVSATAACSWSAASTAWFIHITSGASGAGSGSVNYSVDSFNEWDGYREGTLTVAGRTVTISQSGPPCPFIPPESCTQTGLQTKALPPPRSAVGPKAIWPQLSAGSRWLVSPLGRTGLILLFVCGAVAFLAYTRWRQVCKRFITSAVVVISRLRAQLAWLGTVIRLGRQKLTKVLLEGVRATARNALSLWRSSVVTRFKPVLRRALVIALIVRLAAPLTPAEANVLVLAAQTSWRKVSAYTSAAMKRSVRIVSGARPVKVVSMAPQTEPQVDVLQVCPRQLIMFVGERYTLTPIALAGSENDGWHVVNGAGMNWSSFDDGIARVSSFGQVVAWGVGTTTVQVESGGAIKQISIEVRTGMRPTGSNQDADLDIGDCSEEQASMFAPKSAAVPKAQQNLIGNDGVMLDWDPTPLDNSRAAYFRNAVGNPRFAATSQTASAVPTSTQLGSDNYQFNVPVTTVGGRGVGASIGMTFNSRVWNTDDGKITFNYVGAYPAPGWSMGYGKIIRNYNNTGAGDKSGVGSGNSPGDYLLITGNGTRIRLAAKNDAQTGQWFHESDDGSFLKFNPRSGEMRYPDGTKTVYSAVNGCLLPTSMIGTNGGVITMSYRDYCEGNCAQVFRHRTALSAVRDTLGRYVTFHYYGDAGNEFPADASSGHPAGELAAIKAPDMNGDQQKILQLEYTSILLSYNFGVLDVVAPANNSPIQVMKRVYYSQTGRGFLFLDYSSYGMPRKISSRMGMTGAGGEITNGTEIAYTTYNYMTNDSQGGSLTDFPQFTRREEWRLGQTDSNGNPETTKYDYLPPTTNASKEEVKIKYLDRDYEEVTTIGTDSSQLNFGKTISVEQRRSSTQATLGKQVMIYALGLDGETEIGSVETTYDVGPKRLVRFDYGHYGRVSDLSECGYIQEGGPCQTKRRTHYDYVGDDNMDAHVNAGFLRLVRRVSIFDENNTPKAKTETTYDDYDAMGGMLSYSSTYAPNHDNTYDQYNVMRGNPTGVTTFSDISAGESTTRHVRYDIFGNVVEAQLSCCVVKSFGFTDKTKYSQPEWVRSGPESGLNLQTEYDYYGLTGLVENERSLDGLTYYEYDDAFRLKRMTLPTGAKVEMTLQDDNGNDMLTHVSRTSYADQGTEKVITNKQWFDGSGRILRAGTGTGTDPSSYDMVATIYDSWGRALKQSNPYLGGADGNGSAEFWTVNSYDELSRVVDVTLPGPTPAQTIHTDYDGAVTTVTDTVGRIRKSEVDGLGRLVKVIEQNPANGNPEWETSYSYDVLNNLTRTYQDGQVREFDYDAKSRLTREKTPEAGEIHYTYTTFDAVSTRADARHVVTSYSYGPLNLLTNVHYDVSQAPGVIAPADVNIEYKTASPGKAKVTKVMYGDGTTWSESYGYDQYGRLLSRLRMIDGISYPSQYEYNAAGQMTLMTYPSGKHVKVGHDDRGRLAELKKVDDSGNPQGTYLSGINYRVDGLISGQSLGDGTSEEFDYSNDRLQLTRQKVMKGGSPLLDLTYGYGAGAGKMGSNSTPGNSGQLVSVTGTINGKNRNQEFSYDNVGRLLTATGFSTQGLAEVPWARRYEYDRHGNRTAAFGAVSFGTQLQNMILQQVGGQKTNRIQMDSVSGTAYGYDLSGNVTSIGARTFTYDAQNRLVNVGGPVSESYGYDASNHRVKKVVGSVVTHYIWEGDQVVAEYERGGSNTSGTGTRYYHQDRLSTRIITDGAGDVKGTTDHLPFGEEIGLSDEGEKHKFTTYERDGTELDYAVNRHYDPRQGRFNQADPLGMGAANLVDPQSLNLYSYAHNDPINSVDPTGLEEIRTVVPDTPDGFTVWTSLSGRRGGGGGGGGISIPLWEVTIGEGGDGGGGGGQQEKKPCDPKQLNVKVDVPAATVMFNQKIDDLYYTGVGSSIKKTYTYANGDPVVGASVSEQVRIISGQGEEVFQDKGVTRTDSNGIIPDLVTIGTATKEPIQGTRADAITAINSMPIYSVNEQIDTVSIGGSRYQVTTRRTISNLNDPNKKDSIKSTLNSNGTNVSVSVTNPDIKCLE